MNYLNARYYDGNRGRFISQDPVFLNPEGQGKNIFSTFLLDPQSQNSYSYARNNPVTLSDPSGEFIPLVIGALYMSAPYIITGVEIGLTALFAYQTAKTTGTVIGTATSDASQEYKDSVYDSAFEDAGAMYSAYQTVPAGRATKIEVRESTVVKSEKVFSKVGEHVLNGVPNSS